MLNLFKSKTFDEINPILNFEDNCVIHKREGIVSVGYRVHGLAIEKADSQVLVDVHRKIVTRLDSFHAETILTKHDIHFHEDKIKFENETKTDYEQKIIDSGNNRKLSHKSYIFITVIPEKHTTVTPLNNIYTSGNKSIKNTRDYKKIEEKKIHAKNVAHEFFKMISVSGISFTLMERSEYEKEAIEYLNAEFTSDTHLQKGDYLKKEFYKDAGHYGIGEKLINVVSLSGQGEYAEVFRKNQYNESNEGVNRNYASSIHLDLQIPHVVITTLRKKNRSKALSSPKGEVQFVNVLPDGMPMLKDSKDRAFELNEVLTEINREDHGMLWGSVKIISIANSLQEKADNLDKIKAAVDNMENSKCTIEGKNNAPLFWAGLPANSCEDYNMLTMTTKVGACYLNFNESYKNESRGEIFRDRFNNLIRRDFWSKLLKAKNLFVAGGTGSGKSFLMNLILLMSYLRKEIIVIVDKGGSYKHLVQQLGGKYFEHTTEKPLRINPFITPKDENGNFILDDEKRTMLRTLFEIMIKNTKKGETFTTAEKSFLLEITPEYYAYVNEKKTYPRLEDFIAWLEVQNTERTKNEDKSWLRDMKNFDFDYFMTAMKPYIGKGMYAAILNPEEEEDISSYSLVGFDLDKVQGDEVLYPIMAMLLIDLVLRHIGSEKQKGIIKKVVFDESWSMFTGEMGQFIEDMYRTIRKKNGSVGIITQSVQDIVDSALSQVLINNSYIKILMNHRGVDVDAVQKNLKLSEHQVDLLKSLRFEEDGINSREFWLDRIGIGTEVLGVFVPDEIYPLFTTDANELAHLNMLKKKYSFERALVEFVKDKRAGAIKN
jgi:type IV secretory pathway VirB4 component